MSKEKPMVSAAKVPQVRYSAAYPTGRERIGDMDESNPILNTATLSNDGGFSIFKSGGDTIRFATSPRLVRYTRVKMGIWKLTLIMGTAKLRTILIFAIFLTTFITTLMIS